MPRLTRTILTSASALTLALVAAACGTAHVGPPKTDPNYTADSQAAALFHQRCGGCHTLAAAGTMGSGQNPRTFLDISGPNFNQRCERPAYRVLYAIENGGMSGTYMPQNIVTGKQAVEVANFVARFAGSQAPIEPGQQRCTQKPFGKVTSIPTPAESARLEKEYSSQTGSSSATTSTTTSSTTASSTTPSTTTASTTTATSTTKVSKKAGHKSAGSKKSSSPKK